MDNITKYLNRRINSILDNGILRNVVIDCIIVTEDVDKTLNKEGLILEKKDHFAPVPGQNHFSYRIDKQLGNGGPGLQRHIHMFRDGKEIFAMTVDGTAHDGYHQVEIPKELNPFLIKKGFQIPPDNIIELRQYGSAKQLLCKDANGAIINDEAFSAAIQDIQRIAIVKANVEEAEITMRLKMQNDFQCVEKLHDVPQDKIDIIKRKLNDILKSTGKYADEVNDIMTSYDTLRHLYVAWSNN